jgi:hypothetical protein
MTVAQLNKKITAFYDLKTSLPCLQAPVNEPYTQPAEHNLHPHTYIFKNRFSSLSSPTHIYLCL